MTLDEILEALHSDGKAYSTNDNDPEALPKAKAQIEALISDKVREGKEAAIYDVASHFNQYGTRTNIPARLLNRYVNDRLTELKKGK